MKVFITGDSHAGAIDKGLSLCKSELPQMNDIEFSVSPLGAVPLMRKPFFTEEVDHIRMTETRYSNLLPRLPPINEPAGTVYGFCGAFHSRWFCRRPDWKTFGVLYNLSDKRIVTSSLLQRAIQEDLIHIMGFLAALKKQRHYVFAIETPYPFAHDVSVIGLHGKEEYLYLNREYRRVSRQLLDGIGVPVVNLPGDCIDKSGFMRDKYRHPDTSDMIHANAEFGALMLMQIVKFLSDKN